MLYARHIYTAVFVSLLGWLSCTQVLAAPTISVPANVDHSEWERLANRYVNARGLVNYSTWKNHSGDLNALQVYLKQFAQKPQPAATGKDEIASLINAYNAFTIQWILQNYPTTSIRKTSKPWKKARWNIGGKIISLDDIEQKNLRPLIGWKVHAVLVCAARSCPPLSRHAYTPKNLESNITERFRTWLARADLNHFDASAKKVHLSKIFYWYRKDFKGPNDIRIILRRFSPRAQGKFLSANRYKIKYLSYDWDLNEQK